MIFKIILIGDASVGKTKIIDKYISNEFTENSNATLGVEMYSKELQINQDKITAQIWDTAGQEKYASLTSSYYKSAKGAFVIYDITEKSSLNKAEKFVQDLRNESDKNIFIILVGNKKDLEEGRKITKEEGKNVAQKLNLGFAEVSAKTGEGIGDVFKNMINEVYRIYKNQFKSIANIEVIKTQKIEVSKTIRKKKKCCWLLYREIL